MMTKTEAIVLHSLKYGDRQLIVDLFTLQYGKLSFVVKIPQSAKGKVKKQFFQPLTLLNIEVDYRPNLQLQRLNDVQLAIPYISIPFDAVKLSISLFISEFLCYALRSEQNNVPLYHYIIDSLIWLDNCCEHYANFHLVFLMRFSRFLGFYPNLDDYQVGDVFDLRAATFSAVVPLHRDFLQPADSAVLLQMMRMDYSTMHLFKMNRQDRQRMLETIILYYRLHLPSFPELKSLEVLKELFK
jgi:DNA repair protein RecO (recombination protein O)